MLEDYVLAGTVLLIVAVADKSADVTGGDQLRSYLSSRIPS